MAVRVRYYTDPADSASWAAEPMRRALMVEFGKDLSFTYVMGGLARDYEAGHPDAETLPAPMAGARGTHADADRSPPVVGGPDPQHLPGVHGREGGGGAGS